MTTLIERRGKPGIIVSDEGTELTSNATLAWSKDQKVEWRYIIASGRKPVQNCDLESFSGRKRDELFNESLFFGLEHAGSAIARIPSRQTMPGAPPQPASTVRKMNASRFRQLLTPRQLAHLQPLGLKVQ
jgi:putative transposase